MSEEPKAEFLHWHQANLAQGMPESNDRFIQKLRSRAPLNADEFKEYVENTKVYIQALKSQTRANYEIEVYDKVLEIISEAQKERPNGVGKFCKMQMEWNLSAATFFHNPRNPFNQDRSVAESFRTAASSWRLTAEKLMPASNAT